MAHFAEIDRDGIVLRVIVVDNARLMEDGVESEAKGIAFLTDPPPGGMGLGGTWVQTSFNSRVRKNYAGKGYRYDANRDAFIPPLPVDGAWTFDEASCRYLPVIDEAAARMTVAKAVERVLVSSGFTAQTLNDGSVEAVDPDGKVHLLAGDGLISDAKALVQTWDRKA